MRETHEVNPSPTTELEIRGDLPDAVPALAPGGHQSDPCYGARREIKDYAVRIPDAARAADGRPAFTAGRLLMAEPYVCEKHGPYGPANFCCACTREKVEAERDRYREALERIADLDDALPSPSWKFAREALDG